MVNQIVSKGDKMKKLILLSILLIVGCDEYVLQESDNTEYDYRSLSWASRAEFGGYLDSTYHFEDLVYYDTTIVSDSSYFSGGWDTTSYFSVDYDTTIVADTIIVMVIDTIIYIPTYIANCFYVDTSNQCSSLKPHLVYNGITEDTTSFNQWAEIRLSNNQTDLDRVTIELITGSGLVNPYTDINFYEYLED